MAVGSGEPKVDGSGEQTDELDEQRIRVAGAEGDQRRLTHLGRQEGARVRAMEGAP